MGDTCKRVASIDKKTGFQLNIKMCVVIAVHLYRWVCDWMLLNETEIGREHIWKLIVVL